MGAERSARDVAHGDEGRRSELIEASAAADARRERWHLHFTATSSSWLDLVERWFKELTDKRLRRGAFTSVPDLIEAIRHLGRALERRPQAVRLAQDRT